MKRFIVSASRDGELWLPFTYADTIEEARQKAATCMMKTNHTHVRIEDKGGWNQ